MQANALRTVGISPAEAQRELVRRERAKRHVNAFGEYVYPWWVAYENHKVVGEALMQCFRYLETGGQEGINRLMVFKPPRTGKSTQVGEIFPAFVLGRLPDVHVIYSSYVESLAARTTKSVRDIVSGERFANLFGRRSSVDAEVMLSDDSRSKTDWELAPPHRGGMIGRGIGSGTTGYGAELFIVDDPFRDRDDADSELSRERVDRWFSSVAQTRGEGLFVVIIMHTRWHPDDLAGRRLRAMGSDDPLVDQYTVLDMPALAWGPEELAASPEEQRAELLNGIYKDTRDVMGREPGESIWPEKFPVEAFERKRANLTDEDWASIYAQRPTPPQGELFDKAWFSIEPRAPEGLTWYRYSDLALGKKRTSDWNSCLAVAIDSEANVWYRDMIRVRRWENFSAELKVWMVSPMERNTRWVIESTGFQTLAFREFINDPTLIAVNIRDYTPDVDKVADARILQTRARAGKVKLVDGPWIKLFLSELAAFPRGKNDDQVDTATRGLKFAVRGGRSGIHA